MLLLTRDDVERLLDPEALIEAMSSALAELSAGAVSMPPRIAARVMAHDAILGAMPAYVPGAGALGAKLVTLFPRNTDRPTHQAVIVMFDPATGSPLALMDGTAITAARTAAASALATRLLARAEARVLAVIGTGAQARSHLRYVPLVRRFREIRVAGRDVEKARALAHECEAEGLAVRVLDTYEQALDGADVVCATTHSPEPVVRRRWLSPGVHVNSVGFSLEGREVDADTVAEALLVVESRAAALAPQPAGSGDLLLAIAEGRVTPAHVHAELGEIVSGSRPGRTSQDQITLYKSVGVAAEDAAAAALVLNAARATGAGREVEI